MNTKALRQKILDLAIHGKLVPQDPNDEPASVLLERIRDEKERLIKEGKIKRPKKSKATSDKPHYPYQLPEGWVWTTLGEITNNGDSANVQVDDIDNTDWVLELEDIEKDSANIIQHLTKNDRKINGTRHKFQKGEILYSKLRTYLNKVLVAPNDGFCTTEIMAFGSYRILSNEYICHALRSPYFLAYTLQCGYGVKMPRLSTTDACNGLIPLPPLEEQERIVIEIQRLFSIIDIVEDGKDDLKVAIQAAKSKILDLAIHGKLVPQDPNDKPASELLKRINPNAEITSDNGHYQKLPEGWCECTLGSLFLFIRNGINIHQDKSKIGYPITRIETISSEFIDRSRMGYAAITEDNYSDYYLQKDDILMSHINSPIHVGKCALCDIKAGEKIIHGMNLLCLRPYPDIEAKFILMVFRSPYFKDEIRPFIKNAVNQASINIRNLSSVHLHLPPVSEQHRIVAKIEEIFAQLDAIETSL